MRKFKASFVALIFCTLSGASIVDAADALVTPALATPALATPAPITPALITPAPITPAPIATALATPALIAPALATPALITPALITPAPIAPALPVIDNSVASLGRESGRPENARGNWQKRWAISLAPLIASEALDASSSYGLRELNPLLAQPDGRFGMKAAGIKFGVIGGLAGVEYLLVRKFPRSAKFFTVINWTTAGATTGLAIHNYTLPGR